MEALIPAAKFLLYALGIYFLAGLTISLCIVVVLVVLAAIAGAPYGKRR